MGEAATASAASLRHPWPPCRARMGLCAPGPAAVGLANGKERSALALLSFPPPGGKVRGESAAPGTARPSPEVAEACLCPWGRSSRKRWGRSLQLPRGAVIPGMTGIVQHGAGDLRVWCLGRTASLPRVAVCCQAAHPAAETATVGKVTCQFGGQKVPSPGQAEQPWSPLW